MTKAFGQLLGELILERRTAAGFTQLDLALEAFEDETRVRRIVELENGQVKRPQPKNYGPICETLNITAQEVRALKRQASDRREQSDADVAELRAEIGSLQTALDNTQQLRRDQLEVLAGRFEIAGAPDLSDAALREQLSLKALEYLAYRERIDGLPDHVERLANLKGAAKDAAERLDFDEVEALLARVDEVETEIAAETKVTRADNALLRGRVEEAYRILSAAADSFASIDLPESARQRRRYAGRLYQHGLRYGGRGLALSAEMNRATLGILTEADHPVDWATAQNNLATALQTQGTRTGGAAGAALLAEAVAACRAALRVWTEADHPVDWATAQNNLAIALRAQGERTGGAEGAALLAEAVAACRAALLVWTEADHPVDWAMTQNNLAIALAEQGTRTGGAEGAALLAEAVAAFRAALRVWTEAAHPVDWAMTQTNLASALRAQGMRTGGAAGAALLAEAVAACRAALRVWTEAAHPVDWAMTMGNLAWAEGARADHATCADPRPHLAAALAHVTAALRVFDPEHMPYDYGTATELRDSLAQRLAALR